MVFDDRFVENIQQYSNNERKDSHERIVFAGDPPGPPGQNPGGKMPGVRQGGVWAGGLRILSGPNGMTMKEISLGYRLAAQPIRVRLSHLRKLLARTEDPEELWHIRREIAELTPILTQLNELAELTEHYYDRGYHRSEKYTL